MCVYMHIYIYIDKYTHIFTYIHMYVYMCVYIHISMYVYMYIYMYVYIYIYTLHIHTHTHKRIYMYIHAHAQICVFICTSTHIYLYNHTHSHHKVHTHIHKNTGPRVFRVQTHTHTSHTHTHTHIHILDLMLTSRVLSAVAPLRLCVSKWSVQYNQSHIARHGDVVERTCVVQEQLLCTIRYQDCQDLLGRPEPFTPTAFWLNMYTTGIHIYICTSWFHHQLSPRGGRGVFRICQIRCKESFIQMHHLQFVSVVV